MDQGLHHTYEMVKRSREVLFAYTDQLPPSIYTLEHQDFAYGSIRNIHHHVAECHLWWVGVVGLGRDQQTLGLDAAKPSSALEMREKFAEVDAVLEAALNAFSDLDAPCEAWNSRSRFVASQRWLLMHPITHEFHHKGQLLALGRVLRHPLPNDLDTDLVTP